MIVIKRVRSQTEATMEQHATAAMMTVALSLLRMMKTMMVGMRRSMERGRYQRLTSRRQMTRKRVPMRRR
jgi:hypothetical protein